MIRKIIEKNNKFLYDENICETEIHEFIHVKFSFTSINFFMNKMLVDLF